MRWLDCGSSKSGHDTIKVGQETMFEGELYDAFDPD